MRKYICFTLAILMALCVLTGCSKPEQSSLEQPEISFFMEPVYEKTYGGGFCCYRNTVTDVMYLWYWNMDRGGLTEMSDPETGLPLTYERYKELEKLKQEQ